MHNGRSWRKTVLSVTLLASGLLAVVPNAVARENCRNDGRSRSAQSMRNRNDTGYYGSTSDRYRRDDRYQGGYYRNDRSYRDAPYYDDGYYEPRSAGKSAAIIGGSAAAGAAVGAVTGGKKGAIIGGAVGAAGGLIYDRTTRNDPNRRF